MTGYENVRRLAHECLLPALERCGVLLSRLTGLSKFQKLSDVLGLETSSLCAIIETLDCLHLLAHSILIHTNEELKEFLSFSRWLRHEIDVQSAEPLSQTQEELLERADTIDYPTTLKYVRGALTKSALRDFIRQLPMMGVGRPQPPQSSSMDMDKWKPTGKDGSFYDMFKKLLSQRNRKDRSAALGGDAAARLELPKLNNLIVRLGTQFEKVSGQIALTQRRGILHRSPLALHPDCDKDVIDIAMCYEVWNVSMCYSTCDTGLLAYHLRYVGHARGMVYLHCYEITKVNGSLYGISFIPIIIWGKRSTNLTADSVLFFFN